MKKTWFIVPGYCVGLGGLLLITYRTLLAVGSPGKMIMVSVDRFGEQYLDMVALVFLWVVCLVGLFCLSSLTVEMKRKTDGSSQRSIQDGDVSLVLSYDRFDLSHQRSVVAMMGDAPEGYESARMVSLSVDEQTGSVSVSLVIQQEDFPE